MVIVLIFSSWDTKVIEEGKGDLDLREDCCVKRWSLMGFVGIENLRILGEEVKMEGRERPAKDESLDGVNIF